MYGWDNDDLFDDLSLEDEDVNVTCTPRYECVSINNNNSDESFHSRNVSHPTSDANVPLNYLKAATSYQQQQQQQ